MTTNQLLLSSKMSKELSAASAQTERRYCSMSSETWKKEVTRQCGEYSARLKSAHRTGESESSSWPTATSRDHKDGSAQSCNNVPVNCLLGRAVHGQPDPDSSSTNGSRRECADWITPKQPSGGGQPERTTPGGGLRKLEDQVETKPATKKLNPDWVCCLMGLPAGWVNPGDESSNRTDELRLLGNGVVPQTAAKAIQTLALLLAK